MMSAHRLSAAVAWLSATAQSDVAAAQRVADWRPYIVEASRRFAMPVAWIERVMAVESGGRTTWRGRPIVSRAGAMGLMQLMPATWAEMRRTHGLGSDPHAPRDNILAGAAYLRLMFDRVGYPGLFAAYNAGPARYAEHLASGRPLPSETRAYVAALAGQRAPGASKRGATRIAVLFVALRSEHAEHRSLPALNVTSFVTRGGTSALFAITPRR